ncbi:MAG: DegT/DnrJ/EryC1/StrS family aminotransferase, partial [Flavobacteriaceae bacterium]
AFKDIEGITVPSGFCGPEKGICAQCDCHVFHQYTLTIEGIDRDALVQHLNQAGIPCGVYYPIPLHAQKAYTDERYQEADFSVTNALVQSVISLPMHTELEQDQIDFITQTVIDFVNTHRNG